MKHLCLVILLSALSMESANARPITYMVQLITSGSLNGVGYENTSTTVRMVGDTANVVGVSPYINATGTFTLTISGFATTTFTDQLFVLDNQANENAGFSDATQSIYMLGTSSSVFGTYNLRSSIGPITGSTAIGFGGEFPTAAGAWIIDSAGATSTFTATAAPEPFACTLMCLGLAALVRRSVRQRVHP